MTDHIRPMSHPPSPEDRMRSDLLRYERNAEGLHLIDTWAREPRTDRAYSIELRQSVVGPDQYRVQVDDIRDDRHAEGWHVELSRAVALAFERLDEHPYPKEMQRVEEGDLQEMAGVVIDAVLADASSDPDLDRVREVAEDRWRDALVAYLDHMELFQRERGEGG